MLACSLIILLLSRLIMCIAYHFCFLVFFADSRNFLCFLFPNLLSPNLFLFPVLLSFVLFICLFVLGFAFVLKRSIPLVRGNRMHRVLTDTAKKMNEWWKNYQEQLFITHARAHKHTSGLGARSLAHPNMVHDTCC